MHFIILGALLLLVVFGPQLWAKRTFQKYSRDQEHFPGTGGELARHLLRQYGLEKVGVEITDRGDHYDPQAKMVRLSESNYRGRSITAISVAAHEVGHAVQDHQKSSMLHTRTRLVRMAQWTERFGSVAMLGIPVITAVTRAPSAGALFFLVGLLSIGMSTIVHLVTLPVELDASFGKALPMLKQGQYISRHDETGVRKVLKAAAFTYVAGSLAALLNLARWIAVLRHR